ncbi:MAG: hypothetical protein QXU40_04160, partial [Candidatus Pacearchaeota archaeon]
AASFSYILMDSILPSIIPAMLTMFFPSFFPQGIIFPEEISKFLPNFSNKYKRKRNKKWERTAAEQRQLESDNTIFHKALFITDKFHHRASFQTHNRLC